MEKDGKRKRRRFSAEYKAETVPGQYSAAARALARWRWS